jgi:hypothetical protein
LQTKHLQENYEAWVKELKEEERRIQDNNKLNRVNSNGGSSEDSSTPVLDAPQDETESEETDIR